MSGPPHNLSLLRKLKFNRPDIGRFVCRSEEGRTVVVTNDVGCRNKRREGRRRGGVVLEKSGVSGDVVSKKENRRDLR